MSATTSNEPRLLDVAQVTTAAIADVVEMSG
jgi:hypothetical protein